jgi:hypothetical protein
MGSGVVLIDVEEHASPVWARVITCATIAADAPLDPFCHAAATSRCSAPS